MATDYNQILLQKNQVASKYIVQYAKENGLAIDTVIASIDEFDVEKLLAYQKRMKEELSEARLELQELETVSENVAEILGVEKERAREERDRKNRGGNIEH